MSRKPLTPGVARAKEQPDDEAEDREHQNEHDPQCFVAGRCAALGDANDGPDICNQDQQSEYSADFESHSMLLSINANVQTADHALAMPCAAESIAT